MKKIVVNIIIGVLIFGSCTKEKVLDCDRKGEGFENCVANTFLKISVSDTLNNFLFEDSISVDGVYVKERNYGGFVRYNFVSCGVDSNGVASIIDSANNASNFNVINFDLINDTYTNNSPYLPSYERDVSLPVLHSLSSSYMKNSGFLSGSFLRGVLYRKNKRGAGNWEKVFVSGSFRAKIF